MRIVAGRHRGRPLVAPAGSAVRPTSERARESLFNILTHGRLTPDGGAQIEDALVLDAFCGTGALALEALSRGARQATLMDSNPAAIAAAKQNIRTLGEEARASLIEADVLHPPRPRRGAGAPCSLVFLDPPYGSGLAGQALAALDDAGWIAPGALIIVECAPRDELARASAFEILDRRRYGKAELRFLARV